VICVHNLGTSVFNVKKSGVLGFAGYGDVIESRFFEMRTKKASKVCITQNTR
jgi:hypothetical protein